MSESSFSTISGTSIGSSLMDILYCDEIKPGDTPSYNLAKTIYLYHPFGAKLAEGPCKLAQSQKRIINIPGTPEESLIEAFEREWKTLKCDFHILNADTIKSIYGASVLTNCWGRHLEYHLGNCPHGMTGPESAGLLEYLAQHATRPEFTFRHAWRKHDLVMWDNRATMHRARRYNDTGEVRDMRRTTIEGEPTVLQQAA